MSGSQNSQGSSSSSGRTQNRKRLATSALKDIFYKTDYASIASKNCMMELLDVMHSRRKIMKRSLVNQAAAAELGEAKDIVEDTTTSFINAASEHVDKTIDAYENIVKCRKVGNDLLELILERYCLDKKISREAVDKAGVGSETYDAIENWAKDVFQVELVKSETGLCNPFYDVYPLSIEDVTGEIDKASGNSVVDEHTLERNIVTDQSMEMYQDHLKLKDQASAERKKTREFFRQMLKREEELEAKVRANETKLNARIAANRLVQSLSERFRRENGIEKVDYLKDRDVLIKWAEDLLETKLPEENEEEVDNAPKEAEETMADEN